jgi:hypothetical protein
MVPAGWGYEVLNAACSDRVGLDTFVSEIFAWLDTAGSKVERDGEIGRVSLGIHASRGE